MTPPAGGRAGRRVGGRRTGRPAEKASPCSQAPPRADQPPSEAMSWPVTHLAPSLKSQATRLAVSPGVLYLPPGLRRATAVMTTGSA